MNKPLVILCFPEAQDLNEVEKERNKLVRLYTNNKDVRFRELPHPTIDELINEIIEHEEEIVAFHFGGHADLGHLQFNDQKAGRQGLSALLGRCPRLKLIFLNGCNTYGWQKDLVDLPSKPNLILTINPINDDIARDFACRFHEQVWKTDKSIEDAYQIAFDVARTKDTTITRGMGRDDTNVPDVLPDNSYISILSSSPKNKKLLFNSKAEKYTPNANFVRDLSGFMEIYNPFFKKQRDKLIRNNATQVKKRHLVFQNLPYQISEQLRKLFSVPGKDDDPTKFYHDSSQRRLKQYATIYDAILKFLMFSMLSDLHLQLKTSSDSILSKKMFSVDEEEQDDFNYLETIEEINRLLLPYKEGYFMQGIEHLECVWENGTHPSSRLGKALAYLEELKEKQVDDSELVRHCKLGEKMLKIVLEHTAFVTNFEVCVVRKIYVENRGEKIDFDHETIMLIPNTEKIYDEITTIVKKNYLKNWRIYLRRKVPLKKKKSKKKYGFIYLNISPYVIDINSMIMRTTRESKKQEPLLYVYSGIKKKENGELVLVYKDLYEDNTLADFYPDRLSAMGDDYIFKEYDSELVKGRIYTSYQLLYDQLMKRIEKLTNK